MPNRLATRDRTTYNVEIGLQPIDKRRNQDTVVTVSYHVKPDDVDGDSPGGEAEDGDDNDSGRDLPKLHHEAQMTSTFSIKMMAFATTTMKASTTKELREKMTIAMTGPMETMR